MSEKQLYKVVYHEWEDCSFGTIFSIGHYRKRSHTVIAIGLDLESAKECVRNWKKSSSYNWRYGDRITISKIRRCKRLCLKRKRLNGML